MLIYSTSLDFNNASRPINILDPVNPQDAASKAYVDAAVQGLSWKKSVRVASVANVNLSTPGSTIDGVTMATSDRVLLKDQTTGSQSGIYIWNGASTTMTRAPDADTFNELERATVSVEEGTNAGSTYTQTAVNGTINSTSLVWTSFGTSAPASSETTSGLIEIATQTETDTGTDDARAITPLKLKNWTNRPKRFSSNVGDGSATSIALTHSFGTRDVIVRVYRNSGNYDQVMVDVEHTDTNTVTLKFVSAPALNAYRAVVIA